MALTILKLGQVFMAIVANRRRFCNPPDNFFTKFIFGSFPSLRLRADSDGKHLASAASFMHFTNWTRHLHPNLIIGKSSSVAVAATSPGFGLLAVLPS